VDIENDRGFLKDVHQPLSALLVPEEADGVVDVLLDELRVEGAVDVRYSVVTDFLPLAEE
jgi:hypothetical protein